MHVLDNVDRRICGLFFELFGEMVRDVGTTGLDMAPMIETEARMLVTVRSDAAKIGSANCRTVKTPRASLRLAKDCITRCG